jgi:hypothetical protein
MCRRHNQLFGLKARRIQQFDRVLSGYSVVWPADKRLALTRGAAGFPVKARGCVVESPI